MSSPDWLRTALGEECSAPACYTVASPAGERTVAYVSFRGIEIAADGSDRAAALAALRAKIEARAELLRSAPEIASAEEVNYVSEPGVDGRAIRRFVRPMARERAAIELELGVEAALIFKDESTGNFCVAMRGVGGRVEFLRVGEPVHGDDEHVARPLPVPGRTPERAAEHRLRADKVRRVRALLRCPLTGCELEERDGGLFSPTADRLFPFVDGKPVLAVAPDYDASPVARPESKNTYGQQVLSLIERHRTGWVLDCGSGSPSRGFYNVVHLDLFAFPEVDVVTDGQKLPFADETFDAVLSEAVLEHVPDPDAYLREVARVMKPGAIVRLDVPFLFPYHGYPDHYFNMTRSGLRTIVERHGLDVVSIEVGEHQVPAVSLSLLLNEYANGTTDVRKRAELLATTIGEAILTLAHGMAPPFDGLSRAAMDKIAAGFGCIARKREAWPRPT